ncbi:unfolded protein response Orm1 [Thecamonas trahens ATCC 50062]|uniref:Unfolded protein response Orm1 n=1 Tax=Thecamonas trahens ATCC 50062 TaxID=461836 RepID=A0A0L0D325_THETB|nr:unfolded protein response Orm1 [Thecamonas trahens ATCC 50062]KNC46747.1 unfolded protein response Orm1 [Thecamonas trahens ATCC 50062]|eukprot:XP_013760027.1 unfolded protein response Orm1 [Thecamonas trahens ATCC 50062]
MDEAAPNAVNPNSTWINGRGFWIFYLCLIGGFRFFLYLLQGFMASTTAWTLFNVLHTMTTFVTWHWMKGTPFEHNQGEFKEFTLWEQLDDEVQFTTTRKFFTAVPVVLFLISCHYAHFTTTQFVINVVAVGFALIPKLPYMHRKRILGINKD